MTLFFATGAFPRAGLLELGLGFLRRALQCETEEGGHSGSDWDELLARRGRCKKEILRLGKQLEGANPAYAITVNGKRRGIFSDFLFKGLDKVEDKELQDIMRAMAAVGPADPAHRGKELSAYLQSLSFLNRGETRKMATSSHLARLILALVQPRSIGSLCDLCSGMGILGVKALSENPGLFFYGQEIDEKSYFLSLIHFALSGFRDVELRFGDILKNPLLKDGDALRRFDAVAADLPSGRNAGEFGEMPFPQRFKENFGKNLSSDWLFVQHAIHVLKPGGLAVVVLSTPSLNKAGDMGVRRSLLLQDLVEAVIDLPDSIADASSQPRSALVLRKGKIAERTGKVLMIDVYGQFAAGMDSDPGLWVDEAAAIFREGKEIPGISVWRPVEEIEEKDALLGASGYALASRPATDATPFKPLKTLSEAVFRGIQLSSGQRESAASREGEEVFLLNSGDIRDEREPGDYLPEKIRFWNRKWALYALKEGDLVISARGTVIKTMVIRPEHLPAIASSNVLCARLKEGAVDPHYLKAFLDSPHGQLMLNSVQTGRTIKAINPRSLESVQIPCPEFERQKRIGEAYRKAQEDFRRERELYEKRLKEIFAALAD